MSDRVPFLQFSPQLAHISLISVDPNMEDIPDNRCKQKSRSNAADCQMTEYVKCLKEPSHVTQHVKEMVHTSLILMYSIDQSKLRQEYRLWIPRLYVHLSH